MRRPVQHRTRRRVFARLSVVALLACAPSILFAQRNDQREKPEVRDLQLNGVRGVSPTDLARSIATSESQCKSLLWLPFCYISRSSTFWDRKYLDHDEFRRDVLRILVFYWKRGYREAQVDTAVTRIRDGQVRVVFDIREGPPTIIASLRIQYDSTLLDERRVRKLSVLRSGDPLNLVVLDTMRLMFQAAMWDKGHADAQVDTSITVADRRADVLLRVDPNWITTVGTITVSGNDDVTVRTIQNSIMLRPGELFRYTDLTESQRNLYESNLFRLAFFSVAPRPDSIKNINIEVREAKMHEARIAGGFNNIDFFQFDGRYTNYNTFGGARRFDVTGAIGNLGASGLAGRGIFRQPREGFFDGGSFRAPTWQISADLRQPAWLQKPENALAIGGFAHRRAAPAVYIDRGYGGQLAFTRTLAPRAKASAAYKFEVTRVEASDVYFCVNYGVCDDETISTLQLHQRMNPLQLSTTVDRSDIPFSPTKGYIARIDLEHASSVTLSDYRYNRFFAEGSAYTHFRYPSRDPMAQVLAGHLKLGFVRPLGQGTSGVEVLHPRKRFYAGGAQSVRGYGENQLGPRILTIAPSDLFAAGCDTSAAQIRFCDPNRTELDKNKFTPRPVGGTSLIEGSVEFRYPFQRKMEWAVFLDGAIVGGSEVKSLTDLTQLVKGAGAITPGVGIRYRSPVGPIRVDLGYNPKSTDALRVVTTTRDSLGRETLVQLDAPRRFTTGGTARGFWSLFNRMVLHLSIGQAY
ncbi:MAG TPA: BamA/TamA family outer membrane protein [Gemmatimonadaceae bacterium]|nr:BamA/TamA family outer membrane protein [Gemmatimonadaceae bacterium]